MQKTIDYHIYKDIFEQCTLYDKDNNKIEVTKVEYNEKTKQITLEFKGLKSKDYGKVFR